MLECGGKANKLKGAKRKLNDLLNNCTGNSGKESWLSSFTFFWPNLLPMK